MEMELLQEIAVSLKILTVAQEREEMMEMELLQEIAVSLRILTVATVFTAFVVLGILIQQK